jgi:hypothetical protein
LNEIEEKKIVESYGLRKMLIDQEKTFGIGEIDRKTLTAILESLESC